MASQGQQHDELSPLAKKVVRVQLWFTLVLAGLVMAMPVAAFWPQGGESQFLAPAREVADYSMGSVTERGHLLDPGLGSRFDRYRRARSGPAPRPMDYFSITLENRKIFLDVARPMKRQEFQPSQAVSP